MNTIDLSRKNRKREQRRQSLVDAAKQLFITHGYNGTTIDDIAAQADVAKVTFYYHFKSKEEVVLELKRCCTEEALAYVETLRSRQLPVNEMIEAFIKDVAEWTENNWRLLDVFCSQRFSPLSEPGSAEQCKSEPMTICLEAIIERGQETGHFRKDIDRSRIAHLIDLAILSEQYHWVHSGRPTGELTGCLRKYFDFAINGILVR